MRMKGCSNWDKKNLLENHKKFIAAIHRYSPLHIQIGQPGYVKTMQILCLFYFFLLFSVSSPKMSAKFTQFGINKDLIFDMKQKPQRRNINLVLENTVFLLNTFPTTKQ